MDLKSLDKTIDLVHNLTDHLKTEQTQIADLAELLAEYMKWLTEQQEILWQFDEDRRQETDMDMRADMIAAREEDEFQQDLRGE